MERLIGLLRSCWLLLLSLIFSFPVLSQTIVLSGYVREQGSQELLPGASVYVAGQRTGTQTNNYGHYALSLPIQDSVAVTFSLIGYVPITRILPSRQSTTLTILLTPQTRQLAEVRVLADQPSRTEQMSMVSLPVQQVKDVSALLGEKDVMKALQLLPGVQKGNEGQTGLYVRGGGPDQNLLVLDDAVVYNASHLFGFFSVFNADALKSVELIKGGFPARYGGRLSSVVSMQMKDGNKEKLHGEGGIGLIASRLTLEGPLQKNKSSFVVSARRTYADALLKPIAGSQFPGIYFYDVNAKVNYEFGQHDKLYVSGYFGRDAANFSDKLANGGRSEDGFNWGNATATLRWNHLFSQKLFLNTSLIYSQYNFKVFSDESGLTSSTRYFQQYSSGIRDYTFKTDVDYLINRFISVKAGALVTAHRFTPNAFVLRDINKDAVSVRSNSIDAVEGGVYAEGLLQLSNQIRVNTGLRLSYFGVEARNYLKLEPRLSAAYLFSDNWALKAAYTQMNQYVHLLSNSGLGLPTDLWVPSTSTIPPQQARQISIGLAKDFPKSNLSLTVEGYYKQMRDIIGYKEGASFLILDIGPDPDRVSNVDWQNNVTTGTGRSYGVEWLLQRKEGGGFLPRLTGWIGYTLSWAKQRFDAVNNGQEFFARYDRRHDVSIVGIYRLSPRLTLSTTWVYGTGNALTIPIGLSRANGHSFFGAYASTDATIYGQRNAFRAAAYHRLDVALRFTKPKRWGERIWELGVYNAYNRVNPYYYKSRTDYTGGIQSGQYNQVLARYGLFPIIPTVSYAFKF